MAKISIHMSGTEHCVPFLRVKNARASLKFYEHLGFTMQWVHQFEPGLPLCIAVVRGQLRLFLTEHRGDGNFGMVVYCYVPDQEEFYARAQTSGGRMLQPLTENPWGPDFIIEDLDKNQLRVGRVAPDKLAKGNTP